MKIRVLVAVVILLAVAGISYKRYVSSASIAIVHAGGPHVSIATREHSFGTVKPGTPLRFGFEVKNDGDAQLEIQQVNPSCGCTTSSFDKTIAPGKAGMINLAIEKTEGYSGEVTKTATVVTNDPTNTNFILTLRAKFAN